MGRKGVLKGPGTRLLLHSKKKKRSLLVVPDHERNKRGKGLLPYRLGDGTWTKWFCLGKAPDSMRLRGEKKGCCVFCRTSKGKKGRHCRNP